MFDKRNQGYVEVIKTELEEIRDKILEVFECTSVLGKEINPLLDDIDRRIARIDTNLDAIGLGWASKNTELKDMREMVRKLTIMFNGLVKDLYDKSENAKLKGKKFVVPEPRAKVLKEKWSAVAKKIKAKAKQAEEKKEKRETRREAFKNLFVPLDFDAKEEAFVNEESNKRNADREEIVRLVAKDFGVEERDIRNWPDHMLISAAERILKRKDSKKKSNGDGPKGQGPSFE